MKVKTYLIMKQRQTASGGPEIPHGVFMGSLKEVRNKVKTLNRRALTNRYWFEPIQVLVA